jgi:hypothetical protein
MRTWTYNGVSKSFWTELITKYTQHEQHKGLWQQNSLDKIAIQLHLVEESCTICSSCSRRPVWKLLDTPSYVWCLV